MPSPTVEQLALVNRYLPVEAKLPEVEGGYGWTDEYITEAMTSMSIGPARTVRYFWYQRVQETAEYLDLSKPLSTIHQQARAMLDYWDLVVQTNPNDPDAMEPADDDAKGPNWHKDITFGEIERPWAV